jgi:hypothetical protein
MPDEENGAFMANDEMSAVSYFFNYRLKTLPY